MKVKYQISLFSNILMNLYYITLVDNGKESKNVIQGFKIFCNDLIEINVVRCSNFISLGEKKLIIYKMIDTTYEVNRSYSKSL